MQFSKFDIMIIIVMSTSIICMSFVFPALGLGSEDTSESEIPDFNVSSGTFDFAGEFPDSPGTPESGHLNWNGEGERADNRMYLEGDASDGVVLFTQPWYIGSDGSTEVQVSIRDYANGSPTISDEVNLTGEVGSWDTLEGEGYEIEAEVTEYEVLGTQGESDEDIQYRIEWEITEEPSDGGSWFNRVPLLGGAADIADSVGGAVVWIGSIILWGVGTIISIIVNAFVILVNVTTFSVSMMHWLVSTYSGVIAGANSWAGLVVAIPGILVLLEFAKLTMIALDLIWLG